MIERETTWEDVRVGGYVKDRHGKIWRVEASREVEQGHQFLLAGRHDERTTITIVDALTTVVVLEPSEDEALAVVEQKLGATLVGVKEPGKPFRTPPLPHRLPEIHSHMFMCHGIWTASGANSRSVGKLLEAHKADHLEPETRSHGWVNHTHGSTT